MTTPTAPHGARRDFAAEMSPGDFLRRGGELFPQLWRARAAR
jgi:hypothetical protein